VNSGQFDACATITSLHLIDIAHSSGPSFLKLAPQALKSGKIASQSPDQLTTDN